MTFPELGDWHATRSVLHELSRVLSAIPRHFLPSHPHWWQISLKIRAGRLTLDSVPLPGGGALFLVLDLRQHAVRMETGDNAWSWPMDHATDAAGMAEVLFNEVDRLGLHGLDPTNFETLRSRGYQAAQGERFFEMLLLIDRLFRQHTAGKPGLFGPCQLWPHGFDFSVEWFGKREVEYQASGETKTAPVQLNLGWSPGEESHTAPYFYSNPWPFDPSYTSLPLPPPARWFTDGWQGTLLPYAALTDQPEAAATLLKYASSVFDMLTPRLELIPRVID